MQQHFCVGKSLVDPPFIDNWHPSDTPEEAWQYYLEKIANGQTREQAEADGVQVFHLFSDSPPSPPKE